MPVEIIEADELRRRARAIGLQISELCQRAGIHHETLRRWGLGVIPNMRTYTRVIDVIEEAEAQAEAAPASGQNKDAP